MTIKISPRDWEAISAYLDGQLAPKERRQLEARLQTRADLRAALEELRHTRAVVRAHLPVRASRNFMLTPAMVGMRPSNRPAMRLFPAMRLASALSSLLFIFVVAGELLFGNRMVAPPMLAGVPAFKNAPTVAESASQAPPEAPLALEAQASPAAAAKALSASSPTPEPSPMALSQAVITDTTQTREGQPDVGAGGAGGGEGTADQAALAEMAPSATATPLPTPTHTPSLVSETPPTEESIPTTQLQWAIAGIPGLTPWRLVEVILAGVGIITGLVAFYLYRIGRS